MFCFFFSESRRPLPFPQSPPYPSLSPFAALVLVSFIHRLNEPLVCGQTGGNWLCIVSLYMWSSDVLGETLGASWVLE